MLDDEQLRRQEYVARINRVIDFIVDNLDRELQLKELAGVAHFSPFHFHRIFRAFVGETLHQFISRLRLEKAAMQLCNNPRKSITEIALDCGFSSSATFARAFRSAFNMSAGQWRRSAGQANSKNSKTESNSGKKESNSCEVNERSSTYFASELNVREFNDQLWRNEMIKQSDVTVDVKEFPERCVAYLRHIGPYKGNAGLFESLFNRLFSWAGARDLLRFPGTEVLSVYRDNPELTDENKLRTEVCITVPEETEVEGEIGKMSLPGGRYAVGRFELRASEFEGAWNTMFADWLPASAYQPDDRPCFEIYHNNPREHPEGLSVVDICIPVRPL